MSIAVSAQLLSIDPQTNAAGIFPGLKDVALAASAGAARASGTFAMAE